MRLHEEGATLLLQLMPALASIETRSLPFSLRPERVMARFIRASA